jgi:hypothetical protein
MNGSKILFLIGVNLAKEVKGIYNANYKSWIKNLKRKQKSGKISLAHLGIISITEMPIHPNDVVIQYNPHQKY